MISPLLRRTIVSFVRRIINAPTPGSFNSTPKGIRTTRHGLDSRKLQSTVEGEILRRIPKTFGTFFVRRIINAPYPGALAQILKGVTTTQHGLDSRKLQSTVEGEILRRTIVFFVRRIINTPYPSASAQILKGVTTTQHGLDSRKNQSTVEGETHSSLFKYLKNSLSVDKKTEVCSSNEER